MACINTALNAVPWGKLFKAIKIGIKAFKIYKELNKTYDAVNAAERRASKAMEAFTKAKKAEDEAAAAASKAAKSGDAKASKESASDGADTRSKADKGEVDAESHGSGSDTPSAATECNSFPAGVRVVMGDGTTKSIEDVRDGDTVVATDPQTGQSTAKKVTATITTPDDKDFTDLTLTDDANPRGPLTTITSTYHHPYWSESRRQWTDSRRTHPGRPTPPAQRHHPHRPGHPQLPLRRHHAQPHRR